MPDPSQPKPRQPAGDLAQSRELAGRRVMVTGGCGFIGSHLVRDLLDRGAEVVVVDSLRYGRRENLGEALARASVIPFTLGTDDVEALRPHMEGAAILVHLAAEKHNQSKDTPGAVFAANITGTHDLYDLAGRCGVERIVFSSSLYASGRMSAPAVREDDLPEPSTVYGISKLAGEHLLRHVGRLHGTSSVALRYFFVYGPRQWAGLGYKSVIVKNFERIARGEPPVIFGDGQQALDYIYVDDVVRATVLAMQSRITDRVYNVGSSTALTVAELTRHMLRVAGCELEPVFGDVDWTAGTHRVGDSARIERELGWSPEVSLDEGLRRTYAWVEEEAAR